VVQAAQPQFTSNASDENQSESQTASGGEQSPNEDSLTRARTLRETAEFSLGVEPATLVASRGVH
jgi:hypothetical protein